MAWSPGQYLKFRDERTRPARDLLDRVPLQTVQRIFDPGGGPGNSTELLAQRFGHEAVTGIDSDASMLAAARKRLPEVTFEQADLEASGKGRYALRERRIPVGSGPSAVLERLMDHIRRGGVLAIQMPDNLREPSHVAMEETAASGPWSANFADGRTKRAPIRR